MKARSSGLVLAVVVAVLAALGSTTPRVASAATSCASTQWSADFFGGTALAGTPLVSRCDAAVAFDWGAGSPAAGVPADQFSARWTRTYTFNAGSYTFTATGDDGLRIKVDGMTVVDGWHDQAATTYTGTTTLTAGAHTVVVEYYEAYGNASMSASYAPAAAAGAPAPAPAPAGANLLSNADLSAGAPTPTCFIDGGWGQRTVTAAVSTDVPTGATGRSWRIEQSGYVNGDDKLMPSDAAGCVGDIDPTASYTLGVSYKTTMPQTSLPLFVFTAGSGWSYWTTLTTLPAVNAWTPVSRPVPPPPAGTTRISFGVAGEGNGVLLTTGYSLVRNTAAVSNLAAVGRWTTSSVTLPVRAVHSTLLRDGRVLLIAGSGNDANAFAAGTFKSSVWNPATNTFLDVPTPSDMFCAGHVTLADGRVLIVGGTTSYPNVNGSTLYRGAKASFIFDPATNQFTRINDSIQGHWYPTLTKLENGDVWMAGGQNENGTGAVDTEMYDSTGVRWKGYAEVPQNNQYWGGYPHMYLLADGRMFYAGGHTFGGPRPGTGASIYNWRTGGVADVPGLRDANLRDQAGSVLLPPAQNQRFMIAGGGYADQNLTPTNKVDIIGMNAAAPAYTPGPDLPGQGRLYLNLTTLPDRTVLASNGAAGNRTGDVFAAAIYHPETNSWTSVDPDPVGRNYHASSLLLPDGRVVVMGSNPLDGSFELRVSIYEPPYLFAGTRPTITAAATDATYGQSFALQTAGTIVSASLMSPGSATHQTDTNSRLVDLPITGSNGAFTATVPVNHALLPPGPYMLTVLSNQNVPSVARWINVR